MVHLDNLALFLPVRSSFVIQHLSHDFSARLTHRTLGPFVESRACISAQSQSVVKKTYRIEINAYLNLLRLPAQLQQFLLRPPFCRLRPLLVEFANVIEIVNIVPVRSLTSTALARWRDPNAVDPRRLQVRKCLLQTFPMPLVGRDVPFESLEKASVLRRWFLFWKRTGG